MSEHLPKVIEAAFAAHEPKLRHDLLICRDLIFQVAASHDVIGSLTETLKWRQPSYLTEATGAGTTLRLAASEDARAGLFVHCATSLVEQFKTFYPETFVYQGKRALVIKGKIAPVETELRHCIALALTYKLRRKPGHRDLPIPVPDTKTL